MSLFLSVNPNVEERAMDIYEGTGGRTASIIHVVVGRKFLRVCIYPKTIVDGVVFMIGRFLICCRGDVDVRQFVDQPRPQIPIQRIAKSFESIGCSVDADTRSGGLWFHWCVEGEPGGTEDYDVRATEEDTEGFISSVFAILLGVGLYPGYQPH